MSYRKYINLTCFLTVVILLLSGCGGTKEIQKTEEIVWPLPPDEPRIKFVKSYNSEDDFLSSFGKTVGAIAGKSSEIRLSRPFDVCSDGAGRVFVTDLESGILVFDEVHQKVSALGEKSVLPLDRPLGITYGNSKLFVGVAGLGQVVALTLDGQVINTFGKANQFPNPLDVVYDEIKQRLIIVDNKLHQVFVYSENGDSLLTIGTRGVGDGEFNFPQSAAVDSTSNIYVVDAFNYRIEIFNSNGVFQRKYGQQGNIFGTFNRPKGIALDSYRNVYVVDAMHNNFQIFNNSFEFLMFVGKYSQEGDNKGFENPVGMYIDYNNKIYVVDQLNQRIQVFQLLKGD